ncbi:hypothetical protein KAH43_01940 [Candidatus Bipolaricaulota bacterium]|nr:hypothetical protein [Candidatus Bipolaricaulota bacterium]
MSDKGQRQYTWPSIITDEHQRHPSMTVRDLHKLVSQACFGGDHLLRSAGNFVKELASEWDDLSGSALQGPPLQRIHPLSRVARLHLGPCKAMGLSHYDISRLLLAQPLKEGRRESYEWAWATILHSARAEEIDFPFDLLATVQSADEIGHHSSEYGPAAYRILNNLGHGPTQETLCRLGILS